MPRILQPLLLPQLVEARRSQEQREVDTDLFDLAASVHTRASSISSLPSPVTPTFSLRSQSRYASSMSSFDPASPVLKSSPSASSPIDNLEDSYHGKRSLPDVKEEPLERDEDYDMVDDHLGQDQFQAEQSRRLSRISSLARRSFLTISSFDYDLSDGFVGESESASGPKYKKRRAGDSPFTSIATRLGTSFPSFSRRWRGRKTSTTSLGGSVQSAGPSRASTSRASSLSLSAGMVYQSADAPGAVTPMSGTLDEGEADGLLAPNDTEPVDEGREHERLANTPLLPPLLIPDSCADAGQDASIKSPLQSPTVAASPDTFCAVQNAQEGANAISPTGLPTPPLSTRQSLSSLHRQGAGQLVPCSEIPSIRLADPEDEWSHKLGHANFNIHPEPHLPEVCDAEACEQIRSNWEVARCNYLKHLARTGEHYGVTSKTYQLTQDKWAEMEARWRECYNKTVQVAEESGELAVTFRQNCTEPTAEMKLPSFNDPRSDGKFPKLGDEDIVGPMVTCPPHHRPKPSRRATFFQFLQGVRSSTGVFSSRYLGRVSRKYR